MMWSNSSGKLNFWEIRPFLPTETQNYIPAFIAAVYVMNFADMYGITRSQEVLFETSQIDSISISRHINLSHLAILLNIEESLLAELNPVYKLQLIPHVKNEKFPLILPKLTISILKVLNHFDF